MNDENKYAYSESSVPRLAASLMYGLVQGHSWNDGNKRSSFVCAATFLNDNGYKLAATDNDIYDTVVGVAAGRVRENELSNWFEKNSVPTLAHNSVREWPKILQARSHLMTILSQRGMMTKPTFEMER
jgi:prophage maintenance system killer protein